MERPTQLSLFPVQQNTARRGHSRRRKQTRRRPTQVPHRRSSISYDAGVKIQSTVPAMSIRVLEFLTSHAANGATVPEIQEALNLPSNTEQPRRRWLVKNGFVSDSGGSRPTPSGRQGGHREASRMLSEPMMQSEFVI